MAEDTPPPETWEQRRDRSRQILLAWLPELEGANWQIGFRAGYAEGFKAGWDAHVEHLNRLILEARNETPMPDQPISPPPISAPSPSSPPSNNELVVQLITNKPGLRGVELVTEFGKSMMPIPERTLRTCLYRMKKANRIKIVDGRWYPSEAAPANPQLTPEEDHNGPA